MTRIFSAALVTTLLGGTAFAQVADPPAAPAPAESSNLKISMFADAYYNFSTTKNGDAENPLDGSYPFHRAYNRANGFGLSFMGADLVYDTEKFGATASLRFGPSVPIFYGADKGPLGIDNILQAYVTYKPTSALAIDFGQFGTIYGAEVAESWRNLNYTRGGLYYAMQPFWHTGMRAKLAVTDELTLTGMVVNGVNNAIDSGSETPSIGVQAAYANDTIGAVVGYLGSLNPAEDPWDHFVDVVVTASLGKLNLVFNGDVNMDTKTASGSDTMFYGASLAAGLSLTDSFGLALRQEYLADPDGIIWGAADGYVITSTFTLDFRPDPSGKLIIRWDNRFEKGSGDFFVDRDGAGTDIWIQSVLGLVVTTD